MTDIVSSDAMDVFLKYGKDSKQFNDPVVRCDSCQKLIFRKDIQKYGLCSGCGNTRVRNVLVLTPDEMCQMKRWAGDGEIDEDFLKLFESVQ